MALATKCPHCHTTFRVVHDQLKLRAGLVRCGNCKEIFNGIEHLLPPEPKDTKETGTAIPTSSATHEVANQNKNVAADFTVGAGKQATHEAESLATGSMQYPADYPSAMPSHPASHSDTEQVLREDPLQRMTLMDFTQELPDELESGSDWPATEEAGAAGNAESTSFNAQVDDELDAAIEDLQRKPWRKTKKNRAASSASDPDIDADEEEPGFLRRGRRQQRLGGRVRLFFAIASVLLFVTALSQGVYIFRDQIAGTYPQAKPALTAMCEVLACRIKLPAQIALLTIESSELQAVASGKDRYVLTALLRNQSRTAQEWPGIELTLNDKDEKPLLRRVFKAEDYIDQSTAIAQGIAPGSERLVKLTFSLSEIKASGYRVYLFYP